MATLSQIQFCTSTSRLPLTQLYHSHIVVFVQKAQAFVLKAFVQKVLRQPSVAKRLAA